MKEKFRKCDRCGREIRAHAVRRCPHEAVNEVYGKNICYLCCAFCKYSKIVEYGAQICTLEKREQLEIKNYAIARHETAGEGRGVKADTT